MAPCHADTGRVQGLQAADCNLQGPSNFNGIDIDTGIEIKVTS